MTITDLDGQSLTIEEGDWIEMGRMKGWWPWDDIDDVDDIILE